MTENETTENEELQPPKDEPFATEDSPIEDETSIDDDEAIADDDIQDESESDAGTVIRDTDIVFDCPHCGHNLAIDYRGAGLQINCVNCGESVLVPIPSEMKISDLDLEPGEILKQLFATRRNLQKAEAMTETLAAQIDEMTQERERREAALATLEMKVDELKQLCLQQDTVNGKISQIVSGLLGARPTAADESAGEETPSAE